MSLTLLVLMLVIISIIALVVANPVRTKSKLDEFDYFIDSCSYISETTKECMRQDARRFGTENIDWVDKYYGHDMPELVRKELRFHMS